MKEIAVLLPCLNEEQTIAEVVKDFHHALPEAKIYVFDNNSTDHTALRASEAGAIVYKVPKRGKGRVVKQMFRLVEADIYVMADGDGTYPAECVADLISPIENGEADMVVGDRLSSTYFDENKRAFHYEGNLMVRWLVNKLFHSDIHDLLTGYRAFSRNFVRRIDIKSTGFEIETELTVAAIANDFRISEVVVPYKDRTVGSQSKLNTYSDGVRIVWNIVKLFRDYKPLTFFGLLALVCAAVAIGFNIPVFIDYHNTGMVDRFPTLFCGGFMMVGALLLFCVGLILQVLCNRNG
ncbi:MAG: glycosyltransferase [Bacteroides sp.]|nr:glycosyltransferase [Bacteroides sp.]